LFRHGLGEYAYIKGEGMHGEQGKRQGKRRQHKLPAGSVSGRGGRCVLCGEVVDGTGEHDCGETVPCGYRTSPGKCNYPGMEGTRPVQCATCGSGTQQNLRARKARTGRASTSTLEQQHERGR